jgi:ABC-type bacteriocin/lantibiotic exporter with double-glycine peptidase domain
MSVVVSIDLKFKTPMHLECNHINFFYPGTDISVLRDLCLRLAGPGFHALFGSSGVGKTSLAKLLSGRFEAAAGQIQADGVTTILYAHNQERLPGWSGIGRHLERITPDRNGALKDTLVEKFGLKPYLKQRFNQLSLGQQNRINLLRYLVQDFQMLIMDESLANVDEQTRGRIILTIKEKFPRAIFLYISHNVVEVARYCHQIWVLRDGQRSPQALAIQGQDLRMRQTGNSSDLQRVMLEMVHAA